MDVRVSQPYNKSETSLPSQTSHLISQKPISPLLPNASNRNSRQRWSVTPTSSLAIVETIDYDTDDTESTAATTSSVRERSKAQFRGLMRQLFAWKEKEVPSAILVKPAPAKSIEVPKKDPVVLKSIEPKEGGRWNRFSIIVRPPKPSEQAITPKRVDSGVDVRTLKQLEKEEEREEERRKSSRDTRYSVTSIHSLGSSVQTAVASRTSLSSDTPSSPPLDLTQSQLDHLLIQIKTGITMLNDQTSAAETFSKNLAGLLWSKERSVIANKQLPQESKTMMLATLGKVREQTARTFCRKGIFFERSLAVLARLQEIVESASHGDNSDASSPSRNESDRTARSPSPASDTTLTNEKSPSQSPCPRRLTMQILQSALQTLKADLTAHSHLDPALRNTVVLPTQEVRFPSSEKEKVAMRRFVRFVDGRVKKLGEGYWAFGRWIRGVESWVDDLVDE